jgi:hypothetical protein
MKSNVAPKYRIEERAHTASGWIVHREHGFADRRLAELVFAGIAEQNRGLYEPRGDWRLVLVDRDNHIGGAS